MKIFYITVNNDDEAKKISLALLEKKLAVCTNWFSINCAYHFENKIQCGAEVVLIVKTQANMRPAIERVVAKYINYTHFIAELAIDSINRPFETWLNEVIPPIDDKVEHS